MPIPSLLKSLVSNLREEMGYPASLMQLLATHPHLGGSLDLPKPCISAYTVPAWHQFGKHPYSSGHRSGKVGMLMGWRNRGGNWESYRLDRSAVYEKLVQRDIMPDSPHDISEIHGFSASKSDLTDFESTDAMVETNSREMIGEISYVNLVRNMAHHEIRIFHSRDTADHFTRYLWDGRLWLMNDGGSHHLAAAKYIAARLGQTVPLTGSLHVYRLSEESIAQLTGEFSMFVVSDDAEVSNGFHEAMRAFRATWFWHPMPTPFENARVILLPKAEARSARVASEIAKAGVPDLGAYLADLINKRRDEEPE